MYRYRAHIRSVYDGDTIRADIDCGFGIHNKGPSGKGVALRLFGINAPELRGEERERGMVTRDRLKDLIEGKSVYLQTIKDSTGKYGRYLCKVYLDSSFEGSVNDLLVAEGLAIYKDY